MDLCLAIQLWPKNHLRLLEYENKVDDVLAYLATQR